MRIAILQDHLRSGGTERQSIAIAAGLARRGFEPRLFVFRQGGALDQSAGEQLGPNLVFLRQGFLKTDWYAPKLGALLNRFDPAVVIAMGRMANCHAGLHSVCGRGERLLLATFRTGRAIPWLYRRALRRADHVVANSESALRQIAAHYGVKRSERCSVIHNGCLLPELASEPTRKTIGSDSKLRLCAVSMFRPQKQQLRLIHICSRLPADLDWELTLAGDGPTRSQCEAEAARLGLRDRVRFPGLVENPSALYAQSDLAVHASNQESLPNFLVEAQSAGLPVIAYDVDGVAETFLPGRSGELIPPGDEAAFLESLLRLARDPSERDRMSDAARRHARSRFSLEAQSDAYAALLRNLATHRPSPTLLT